MAGACDSVTRLLSPYVDDALSGADRAAVEQHLKGCPDCPGRLADLRAAQGALGGYFEAQAQAADFSGFTQRVMQQIRREPLSLGQRARLWWAELMAYHSTAIYSGFGAAVAAAAIAVVAVRPAAPAPANNDLVVHSLQVTDPRYAPVVMHTDDGDSVIMFVENPQDDGEAPAAAPGEPAPKKPASPAAPETPHGGNL